MKQSNGKVEPVAPGTLLRYHPQRDTDQVMETRTRWLMRRISPQHPQIHEVESFIWDRKGTYVTLERRNGTYVVFGGGRMEDIKFPYPHPMFEVIGEADAARIRLEKNLDTIIEITTKRPWWVRLFLPRFHRVANA